MATFTNETFKTFDNYTTPKKIWEDINHLIPRKVIWEAFYFNGTSGQSLKELGHQVIHDNINFFSSDEGEIIVSNPPFSLKKEVMFRLKALDKPFIMVLPISTLTTNYFRETFADKIQLIIPRQRIQRFMKLDKNGNEVLQGRCNFDCAYFCYQINLPQDIVFL